MQDQIDSNKNDADRNNRQSEVYDPTISPSWYEAGRKADDNNDAQLLSNGGNNNCEMVLNDNDCKYYDEFINKGPNNSMSFDYHDIEHYSANPQQQQMVEYEQPKMVAYEQPQMVAYEQPQMVAYKQPQLVPYEPPQIVVHDKKSEKKLKKTNSGKRRTQGDRRMKNVGSVKDGTKDRKIEETEDDNLEKNGSVDANKNNYQNNNEDGEVCYGYDTNQKKGWCWNFRNKQPIIQDRKKQFHIQLQFVIWTFIATIIGFISAMDCEFIKIGPIEDPYGDLGGRGVFTEPIYNEFNWKIGCLRYDPVLPISTQMTWSQLFAGLIMALLPIALIMIVPWFLVLRSQSRKRCIHISLRLLYPLALFFNVMMCWMMTHYSECHEEDTKCLPGYAGILAMINCVVLFLLSILIFTIPPPGHSYFVVNEKLLASPEDGIVSNPQTEYIPLRIKDSSYHEQNNDRGLNYGDAGKGDENFADFGELDEENQMDEINLDDNAVIEEHTNNNNDHLAIIKKDEEDTSQLRNINEDDSGKHNKSDQEKTKKKKKKKSKDEEVDGNRSDRKLRRNKDKAKEKSEKDLKNKKKSKKKRQDGNDAVRDDDNEDELVDDGPRQRVRVETTMERVPGGMRKTDFIFRKDGSMVTKEEFIPDGEIV